MNKKEFSLKNTETILLNGIQQQANAIFGQAVCYILVDRLAYPVTENTRFSIEDNKLVVWEEAPTPTVPEGVSIAEASKESK